MKSHTDLVVLTLILLMISPVVAEADAKVDGICTGLQPGDRFTYTRYTSWLYVNGTVNSYEITSTYSILKIPGSSGSMVEVNTTDDGSDDTFTITFNLNSFQFPFVWMDWDGWRQTFSGRDDKGGNFAVGEKDDTFTMTVVTYHRNDTQGDDISGYPHEFVVRTFNKTNGVIIEQISQYFLPGQEDHQGYLNIQHWVLTDYQQDNFKVTCQPDEKNPSATSTESSFILFLSALSPIMVVVLLKRSRNMAHNRI